MNYEKYLMGGLIVLIALIAIYSVSSLFGFDLNKEKIIKNEKSTGAFQSISTGSTDASDVSIELTPHNFEDGKLDVAIAVNTHSVDISQFDLLKITRLEFNGKSIQPISAPELNGHHTSGTILFDIGKELKLFKIIIKGIPKVEERLFEWY